MKPFDTKGEYTPEEVKAALAGISGTRQLSYRYERLDKNNSFIEDIDYVQSCTIENNALADIKRTAKLDVLDTGSINYLQDRIKPYVRLDMPADKDYNSSVRELDPDVWWRFDDADTANKTLNNVTVADGLTYQTRATALVVDISTGIQGRSFKTAASSGTHRSEMWLSYEITDSKPLLFQFNFGYPQLGLDYEIFTSPTATDPLTKIYPSPTDNLMSQYTNSRDHAFPFPVRGFYYVRLWTTNTTVTDHYFKASKADRLEDSSDNGIYAVGNNLGLGNPPLVGGGGSLKSTTAANEWITNKFEMNHKGAVAINFWYTSDMAEPGYSTNLAMSIPTRGQDIWSMGVGMNAFSPSTNVTFDASFGYWYGEVTIPYAKLQGGPHMITYYYTGDRCELYVDAEKVGDFVDPYGADVLADFREDFDTSVITSIEVFQNSSDEVSWDDMTVFFKPVTQDQLTSIYRDGMDLGAVNQRSGYVEWPQGVFVLSSPSRKMVNGNQVVRAVEGYDQLVVLKEDSFPYRYSVGSGIKYTDAVKTVLQSTVMPIKVPLSDDVWGTLGSGEILADDSFRVTNKIPLGYSDVAVKDKSFVLDGLSFTGKVNFDTTSQFGFIVTVDEPYSGSATTDIEIEYPSTIYGTGSYGVKLNGVTRYGVASSQYFKLYYDKTVGRLVFNTSADNITWNAPAGVDIPMPLKPDSRLTVKVWAGAAGSAKTPATFTSVNFTAARVMESTVQDSTSVLPTTMEWEPGTPKLEIINDLLGAINYESASYDEEGKFVGKKYILPQDRTSQFRYATDSESVITGDISQTVDVFGVPNTWIVVVSDPDRPALTGTYVNSSPLSPTSTVSRGRTIVDFRTEQNAPDQLTLDAKAERLAFEASQVYEVIEFNTALMPIHQNADVYDLIIDGIVVDNKYSEHSWSMTLSNGSTMTHKVRKVITI